MLRSQALLWKPLHWLKTTSPPALVFREQPVPGEGRKLTAYSRHFRGWPRREKKAPSLPLGGWCSRASFSLPQQDVAEASCAAAWQLSLRLPVPTCTRACAGVILHARACAKGKPSPIMWARAHGDGECGHRALGVCWGCGTSIHMSIAVRNPD